MAPEDKRGRGSGSDPAGVADGHALAEFEREFGRARRATPAPARSPTTASPAPRVATSTPSRALPLPAPAATMVACRDPAHVEVIAALEKQLEATAAELASARASVRSERAEVQRLSAMLEGAAAAQRVPTERITQLELESAALREELLAANSELATLREALAKAEEPEEGGGLAQALSRFSTACLIHGKRRILFVGGSPEYRRRLKEGLDPRLSVGFAEGDLRRIPQSEAADLVVVWGATELDPPASEPFAGSLYVNHRGLTAMLRKAAERLEAT